MKKLIIERICMVRLYFYKKSDLATKKIVAWLTENKIEFIEQDVVKVPLSSRDIIHMLSLVEGNVNEVLCIRGKEYQKLNENICSIKMNHLINLLEENQKLLRFPVLLDEKRMQIGFNTEELRKFIPREKRRVQRNFRESYGQQ